ncbi:MAG: hypothetical protein L0Y50_13220 [Beijerinckiaceae bacterium]|nr:hypothetical protein [Beijerinckiaceae bacterium]MCI0737209.1 hypothetical protein [Beijerinckiaceae bacterium]
MSARIAAAAALLAAGFCLSRAAGSTDFRTAAPCPAATLRGDSAGGGGLFAVVVLALTCADLPGAGYLVALLCSNFVLARRTAAFGARAVLALRAGAPFFPVLVPARFASRAVETFLAEGSFVAAFECARGAGAADVLDFAVPPSLAAARLRAASSRAAAAFFALSSADLFVIFSF